MCYLLSGDLFILGCACLILVVWFAVLVFWVCCDVVLWFWFECFPVLFCFVCLFVLYCCLLTLGLFVIGLLFVDFFASLFVSCFGVI